MWDVCCFESWCAEKDLAIDLKTITKTDLNQVLHYVYATMKNRKGEPDGFRSYVIIYYPLGRERTELCDTVFQLMHKITTKIPAKETKKVYGDLCLHTRGIRCVVSLYWRNIFHCCCPIHQPLI